MAARKKTGQRRERNQSLKIDRLPQELRDRILLEHNQFGRPWEEIEQGSSTWTEWEKVAPEVVKLFPGKRLPHTTLHRWYDLRVAQVQRDVMAKATQAREIAVVFAKATVNGADDAVLNAARDLILGMLHEGDAKSQMKAASGLIALAEVMQEARANTIKERKVAVDERKLKALEAREELNRRKLERETESAAKKLQNGGELTLDDINRIRERTFGLPPVTKNA